MSFLTTTITTNPTFKRNRDGILYITTDGSEVNAKYSLDGVTFINRSNIPSDPLFINLKAGSYTLYYKDDNNSVNTSAFVLVEPIPKYVFDYINLLGEVINIEILERNFEGETIELPKLSGEPFVIEWSQEGDDKFEQIKGSQGTIGLWSESNFQFIDLFTGDDRKYRLDHYKDSNLFWSGYIQVDTYIEPFIPPPYIVSATFLDGLGTLQYIDFELRGKKSLFEIIQYCLNKAALWIPFNISAFIYDPVLMVSITDTYEPFKDWIINIDNFEDLAKLNCFDMLRYICESFQCRIFQDKGEYHIIDIVSQLDDYVKRKYDIDGNFLGAEVIHPVFSTRCDKRPFFLKDGAELEIKAGIQSAKVEWKWGTVDNLIIDGDFKKNYEFGKTTSGYFPENSVVGIDYHNFLFWETNMVRLLYYRDSKYYISTESIIYTTKNFLYLKAVPVKILTEFIDHFEIKFDIRDVEAYGKIRIRLQIGSQYLKADNTWTSTEADIEKNTYDPDSDGPSDQWSSVTIDNIIPPESGTLIFTIFQIQDLGHPNDFDPTRFLNKITQIANVEIVPHYKNDSEDSFSVTEKNNINVFTSKVTDLEVHFGPGPTDLNSGELEISGSLSTTFARKESLSDRFSLAELLAKQYLTQHIDGTWLIHGSFWGDISFQSLLFVKGQDGAGRLEVREDMSADYLEDGRLSGYEDYSPVMLASIKDRLFMWNGASYADRTGIWSGEFIELLNNKYLKTFFNTEISQTFQKNNCSSGSFGSYVTYTVAANKYKSLISQADAQAKAQAEIDANGQIYANNVGNCLIVGARMELRNIQSSSTDSYGGFVRTAEIYIAMKDQFLHPISVVSLDVNYSIRTLINGGDFTSPYDLVVNGTEALIGTGLTIAERSADETGVYYDAEFQYNIEPGTGYIPVL